jgi:hypothetical protein
LNEMTSCVDNADETIVSHKTHTHTHTHKTSIKSTRK